MKTRFFSNARVCGVPSQPLRRKAVGRFLTCAGLPHRGGDSLSPLPAAVGRFLICAVLLLPGMLQANGTAYYFDVNYPTPGLGSPAGPYNQNGAYWTTDATGNIQPVALPASVQMTFGATNSDFNGDTFSINMNAGLNWTGLLVNSTNANITITGTANSYLSGAQTWTVAAGSVFTDDVTWSAGGLNFNATALTLAGGGTINFQTPLGYNETGSGITENDSGAGLTVNVYDTNITFSAGFTLVSGLFNFAAPAAANALGTGTFSLGGGKIDNTSGAPLTLFGMSGINLGGSFAFVGSTNLSLGTSPVTMSGNPTITVNSNTLTMAGNISGSSSLTKTGAGTLALNGVNTYNGVTKVNAGELIGLTGGSCSNSVVTVTNGATIGVQVVAAGGSWACAGLTNGSGATYADFNFIQNPSTTVAPLLVNSNLVLNGALQVIIRGSAVITPGTYPLIKYTGTLSGTPPTTVFSLPPLMAATLVNDTARKTIDLNVTAGNELAWAVGSGSWDTTSPNWQIGAGIFTNYTDGDLLLFDDSASGPSPINVDLEITVNPGGITANPTNFAYVIGGGGSIAGTTPLTKNGPGTLTLNGANSFTGGTVVNAGTLALGNSGGLGDPNGPLTVTGGTLDLGGNQPYVGTIAMSGGTIQNGMFSSVASLTANPAAGAAALMNASFTTSGALTVSGAGGFYLNGDANGDPITLSGTITDLGTLNLNNANSTLTTSGTGAFFVGLNNATGIVNQAGATVNLGQNYGSYSLLMGNGNAGTASFYNLSSGTLTTTYGLGLGINNNCLATFNMSGGTLNALANLEIGRNYGPVTTTTNYFSQSGGTVTVSNLFLASNTNQVAYLSISNAVFSASNFVKLAASPGAIAHINLGSGGVANLPAFPTPDPTAVAAGNVTFTNNGGTLGIVASSGSYLPASTFSSFLLGTTNVGGSTFFVPSGVYAAIGQSIGMTTSLNNNLIKTGGGELILNGANTYNYITTVLQGTLRVNANPACGYVNVGSGATYGGNSAGVYILSVSNGAALSPGSADNTAGQLTVKYGSNPKLIFLSGAMLNLDLYSTTNGANNDLVGVAGASALVTNNYPMYVNINLLNGPPALNQPYTIITNQGAYGSGFVANLVAGVSRYTPTFAQSGKAITVTFTSEDPRLSQLVWQGDSGGNDQWITGITNEWLNGAGNPSVFYTGDATTFNDNSPMSYVVNLVGTLLPSSVTVQSASGYTFQGSGSLAGATTLIQGGTAPLNLDTTNTYTGGTIISNNAGTVVAQVNTVQDALGTGPVWVGAGAGVMCELLDTATASGAVTTIGNVFSGAGWLQLNFAGGTSARNTYMTAATNLTGTIELANSGTTADKWNVTPGNYLAALQIDSGSQLFDTTAGITAFNSISVQGTGNSENRGAIRMSSGTAVLAGSLALQGNTTIGMEAAGATISGAITNATSSPVILTDGTANSSGSGTFSGVLGDGTAGGTLALVMAGTGTLVLSNANTFSGGATINAGAIQLSNANALSNSIVTVGTAVGTSSYLTFAGGIGTFTVGGLSGYGTFGLQDIVGGKVTLLVGNNNSSTTYDGGIGNLGNLVKIGQGTLTFSGAAGQLSNLGTLAVSNGMLVVNCGTGSNSVVVAPNGTLSGTGPFNGLVSVQAGGTLTPGTNSSGTPMNMTLASNLVLNAGSFTTVVVDKGNSVYNQIANLTGVTYGGTLIVSNLSGTLVNGDSFPIFTASSYSNNYANNFTSISGPPVPAGLQWNFTPATGLLSVGPPPTNSIASNPTNITYTVHGSTLTLKWPADHLGWYVQSNAVSLAKTNDWYSVPGSQNGTNLIITINPAKANVFYRLGTNAP